MRNLTALMTVLLMAGCSTPRDIDMATVEVSASAWESKAHGGSGNYPPALSIDGEVSGKSSWRAEGDGAWIQYDLGKVVPVKGIQIAFHGADKRRYTFDVDVSVTAGEDDWVTVLDRIQSVEGSLKKEMYRFAPSEARYIRIVGHGNTHPEFGEWINIVEVGF